MTMLGTVIRMPVRAESALTGPMIQYLQIARAVDAIGQPGFLGALAELCEAASGFSSTFVSAYFPDHRPVELFDNLEAVDGDATVAPYVDFAYLLDPFYNLYRKGIGDAVVSLADCAPDDFKSSEYYRTFYTHTGLCAEANIFVNFPDGAALAISLGSRDEGFQLPAEGHATLEALVPVIAALCRRHWPRLTPYSVGDQGRMGLHLQKSFERFGTSVLSEREAEIMRLVLKGHSSKSIARLLGNSPETIKVHRKNLYAKLGIASQGELFSIFLDALGRTPPNANADPLTYLDRPMAPRADR